MRFLCVLVGTICAWIGECRNSTDRRRVARVQWPASFDWMTRFSNKTLQPTPGSVRGLPGRPRLANAIGPAWLYGSFGIVHDDYATSPFTCNCDPSLHGRSSCSVLDCRTVWRDI